MRGQMLLPGLAVTDLIAVGKTIAISMDAAVLVGEVDAEPRPVVSIVVVLAAGLLHAVIQEGIGVYPSQVGVMRHSPIATEPAVSFRRFEECIDLLTRRSQ